MGSGTQGGRSGRIPPTKMLGDIMSYIPPPQSWWFRNNRDYPCSEATYSFQCMPASCRPHSSFNSPLMTIRSEKCIYQYFCICLRNIVVLPLLLDRFCSPSVSINSAPYQSTFGVVSIMDHGLIRTHTYITPHELTRNITALWDWQHILKIGIYFVMNDILELFCWKYVYFQSI